MQPDDLSRHAQTLLNQGLIEQVLIDHLNSEGRVHVEWEKRAETLSIDEFPDSDDDDKFPVAVGVRRLGENGLFVSAARPGLLSRPQTANQTTWKQSAPDTSLHVMAHIAGREGSSESHLKRKRSVRLGASSTSSL